MKHPQGICTLLLHKVEALAEDISKGEQTILLLWLAEVTKHQQPLVVCVLDGDIHALSTLRGEYVTAQALKGSSVRLD